MRRVQLAAQRPHACMHAMGGALTCSATLRLCNAVHQINRHRRLARGAREHLGRRRQHPLRPPHVGVDCRAQCLHAPCPARPSPEFRGQLAGRPTEDHPSAPLGTTGAPLAARTQARPPADANAATPPPRAQKETCTKAEIGEKKLAAQRRREERNSGAGPRKPPPPPSSTALVGTRRGHWRLDGRRVCRRPRALVASLPPPRAGSDSTVPPCRGRCSAVRAGSGGRGGRELAPTSRACQTF